MKALIILAALLLAGCCDHPSPGTDLGHIKSVDVKTSSWNACDVIVVTTDKMVVLMCAANGAPKAFPIGGRLLHHNDHCHQSKWEVVL